MHEAKTGVLRKVEDGELWPVGPVSTQSISSASGPIYQVLGVLSDRWAQVYDLMWQVDTCWVQGFLVHVFTSGERWTNCSG